MAGTVKINNAQIGDNGTATNNFTWYQPATPDGTVRLGVGNAGATSADVLTANSSGNLGLGVTPSAWTLSGAVAIQNKNAGWMGYLNNSYLTANASNATGDWKYIATAVANLYAMESGAHKWYYAASGTAGNTITFTQAMTLDSSGNLLINKTSTAASGSGVCFQTNDTSQFYRGGDGQTLQFFRSSSQVGSISVTGTATAFNTSSDYRLKEAIAPMTGALAKVAALKPVTYKWKFDGSDGQGFIAHELAEVEPGCVTGEKDAVDADGNPVYQGIDTSFLVATLTAAIQEQQAQIEALKAEVAALKAR